MKINHIVTTSLLSSVLLLGGCSSMQSTGADQDYMALSEQARAKGQDDLALKYLTLAADKENVMAQSRLGEAYLHGSFGLNNPAKGFAYTQKAASHGDTRAMTNLGVMYLYGMGVKQDYQVAREWLGKANQAGDMKAPRYLGLIYENGWGVDVDYIKAAENYQKGADHGDITSQYYLGKLYENGKGVTKDYDKALALYQQSAARGDIVCLPAILALGVMYEHGLGVEKNIDTALNWYKKAAALGDAGAKMKVGKYQYPDNPEVMNVSALVKVIGDGQKVAGLAIEYTGNVDAKSLDIHDYQVTGREVTSVYLSDKAVLGQPSATGSFVIVELKTEIDPKSSVMPGPPKDDGSHAVQQGPGPGGPQLGQLADDSPEPEILTAGVVQAGEITLTSGEKVSGSNTSLVSNTTLNPDIAGFKQFVFHDPQYKKDLKYNLYVPKNYDPSKSYPLVLFMHDAGVVSNNPIGTLTQGLGAVVWASDRDQSLHESFVLAPQYNTVIVGDSSKATVELDVTVDLLKDLQGRYSIDANRLYNTGQSMGGMTSIAMNIKYPDLFAASFLVACQWDPALVTPMAKKPLWIVVSKGDTKANPGMDAITGVLAKNGATIAKATWNAQAEPAVLANQVKQMLSQNASVNYTVFEGGSHTYTWQYAYSIDGIRDWLFTQHK